MAGNKKHRNRPRDKSDPVIGSPLSVRLRESHHNNLKNLLQGTSFSGYVGNLIDDRIKSMKFLEGLPNFYKLDPNSAYREINNCIGEGVNAEDVSDCLIAWIENEPIIPIRINDRSRELYAKFFDSSQESKILLHDALPLLFELIDGVSTFYCLDKSSQYTLFEMACEIENSSVSREIKQQVRARLSAEEDSTRLHFDAKVAFSPFIRSATYICWKNMMLRQPPKLADLSVIAHLEEIKKYYKTLIAASQVEKEPAALAADNKAPACR